MPKTKSKSKPKILNILRKRKLLALAGLLLIVGIFAFIGAKRLNFGSAATLPPYVLSDWRFSPPGEGYSNTSVKMKPTEEPGNHRLFFAYTFYFKNGNQAGAYMGLQNQGHRFDGSIGKTAIFSIWDGVAVSGSNCGDFGGEGTGKSCRIAYNWVPNREYRFDVTNVENRWWEAAVTDLSSNSRKVIGRIQVPSTYGLLWDRAIVFTENFGTIASCSELPYVKVNYSTPTMNNGSVAPANFFGTTLARQDVCTNWRVTNNSSGLVHEVGAGIRNGLKGGYFNSTNFTSLQMVRVDPSIYFNWAASTPSGSVGNDTFSVRWTGKVKSLSAGSYSFCSRANDGARLWVNNVQLVNDWTTHTVLQENCKSINLAANTSYPIKFEYFENTGNAAARLVWTPPGGSKQDIPAKQLTPP